MRIRFMRKNSSRSIGPGKQSIWLVLRIKLLGSIRQYMARLGRQATFDLVILLHEDPPLILNYPRNVKFDFKN